MADDATLTKLVRSRKKNLPHYYSMFNTFGGNHYIHHDTSKWVSRIRLSWEHSVTPPCRYSTRYSTRCRRQTWLMAEKVNRIVNFLWLIKYDNRTAHWLSLDFHELLLFNTVLSVAGVVCVKRLKGVVHFTSDCKKVYIPSPPRQASSFQFEQDQI